MAPRLKDVAELVGVTPQLVSFYLNHPDTTRVKKETRDKIDEAVRKLNYRTNTMGRALVAGKTNTIGLIIGGFSERKRGCFAHMLMNEAKRRGYHLLISITNYNHEEEREELEQMISRQVDGIVYTLDLEDESDIAQRIEELKLPFLLHSQSPRAKFDTAGSDYSEALDKFGRFLQERNKKRLYYHASQEKETINCIEQVAQKYSLELTVLNATPFDDSEFCDRILKDKPDAVLDFNGATIENLVKHISRTDPQYKPSCFCGYGLPFEFIDDVLVEGYFRRQEDAIKLQIEQLIKRIENPDNEASHLPLTARFMTADDVRELRAEQLSSPEYQLFQ